MKGAPVATVVFLAIGAFAGYSWRAQEVANLEEALRAKSATIESKDALIGIKDGELNEYQRELESRIRKLEKLTEEQQSSLMDGFSVAPGNAVLSYPPEQSGLGEDFAALLRESGWQVVTTTAAGIPGLQITTEEQRWNAAVTRALDSAGIAYSTFQPLNSSSITDVIIQGATEQE